MLLGCIGDDFTGSSDLGNMLTKAGMYVVQYSGVPDGPAASDVEAGIVALKSRSIPVQDAIEQSLAALAWLQEQGCQQFFFKYCSTFDSTPQAILARWRKHWQKNWAPSKLFSARPFQQLAGLSFRDIYL